MIDTNGAAPVAAPAAPSEAPVELVPDNTPVEPVLPPFDYQHPRVFGPNIIELDRPRRMRLSFKALRLFEEATGISPWNPDVLAHPTLPVFKRDVLVTLLWVSLLDEDPNLTKDQLEDFPGMEFGNIHYLRNCLLEMWGNNMPPPEDSKAANGTGPKASRPRG